MTAVPPDQEEVFTRPLGRSKSWIKEVQGVPLDVEGLKKYKIPVQQEIEGVLSFFLGLGNDPPKNLELRKRLGKPGAPFGGIGFFDPQQGAAGAPEGETPPPTATAEFVRRAKLAEFDKCARGQDSVYMWTVQPIYDTHNDIVAAEILVRAKNGSDSAPYEDVVALMTPDAPEDVKAIYANWKAVEIVDWTLKALKDYPCLQRIHHISANVRPLDLLPTSAVFQKVEEKVNQLSDEEKSLLSRRIVIEVTEDQKAPENEGACLEDWAKLGFKLAYDDAIGPEALKALGKHDANFHTIDALTGVLDYYSYVKVDIEWAGMCLFLSHPSYAFNAARKAEVLEKAQTEGVVYVPKGQALASTGIKHKALLAEFATWAKEMISRQKPICIELTVTEADTSHAYVLKVLKDEYGLDIFGSDSESFCFQGGPTGAKAFEPRALAESIESLGASLGSLGRLSS